MINLLITDFSCCRKTAEWYFFPIRKKKSPTPLSLLWGSRASLSTEREARGFDLEFQDFRDMTMGKPLSTSEICFPVQNNIKIGSKYGQQQEKLKKMLFYTFISESIKIIRFPTFFRFSSKNDRR